MAAKATTAGRRALDALAMQAAWDIQTTAEKVETCALYLPDPDRFAEVYRTATGEESSPDTIRTFFKVQCEFR